MELRDIKGEQILMLGAVAGGLYLLYQIVEGLKEAAPKVADAATKAGKAVYNAAQTATSPVAAPIGWAAAAIWKTWDWATNPNSNPTGYVVLPDNTKLPFSQLAVTFNNAYNLAQFNYQGRAYVIPQNPDDGPSFDNDGNYHAVLWDVYRQAQGL